jgi:hypothetical protein
MSQKLVLDLSDEVYCAIKQEADQDGAPPARWLRSTVAQRHKRWRVGALSFIWARWTYLARLAWITSAWMLNWRHNMADRARRTERDAISAKRDSKFYCNEVIQRFFLNTL